MTLMALAGSSPISFMFSVSAIVLSPVGPAGPLRRLMGLLLGHQDESFFERCEVLGYHGVLVGLAGHHFE